jgi:RHS repeat-associated protein
VPNRASVKVGAGATATTAFDAADRPTSGTNPTAAYASDDDGRLTARPGQTLEWDHLGRLTAVKDAAGTTTLARYAYDPLDRLKVVEHPGTDRIRLRYVGTTTGVVQWLDDIAGTVTRSVANSWTGVRLADWTGSGSNLRIYGSNAHHDTTWLGSNTGTVSQSLRYDPWGTPRTAVPSGYSPFRFQGSWHDPAVDLSWVVSRWYAPALGRFVSEDTLLGEPADPPSRHLYAYGQGEPVGRWDPDGLAPLGTCGGWGCVARAQMRERLGQMRAFFRRFPGYSTRFYYTRYVYTVLPGLGRGEGIIKFMQWEVDSGRGRSPWWNRVNKELVQGALNAWRKVDNGSRYVRPTGSIFDDYLWLRYAKTQWLPAFDRRPAGFFGGTWQRVWDAHQKSLWIGVKAASALASRETRAERLVMWKVLVNVESYYRAGIDADGALDFMRSIARYPDQYPATARQACDMVHLSTQRAYVNQFLPRPTGGC